MEVCAERGIKDVILEVRASNDAARCLYTKYGFETISLRKDYYKEPMEHGLTMQKNYLNRGWGIVRTWKKGNSSR